MPKAFLVNDAPLPIRNPSEISIEINGITSTAERCDSGDMVAINKVNSIAKITASWDALTIEEMETLCNLFEIDVATYKGTYAPKTIADLVYKITARLPCGVRSFSAYVGDVIKGDLVDYSGEDSNTVCGEYWRNVSINLVGTGEQWDV